jgi:hypothetical protein
LKNYTTSILIIFSLGFWISGKSYFTVCSLDFLFLQTSPSDPPPSLLLPLTPPALLLYCSTAATISGRPLTPPASPRLHASPRHLPAARRPSAGRPCACHDRQERFPVASSPPPGQGLERPLLASFLLPMTFSSSCPTHSCSFSFCTAPRTPKHHRRPFLPSGELLDAVGRCCRSPIAPTDPLASFPITCSCSPAPNRHQIPAEAPPSPLTLPLPPRVTVGSTPPAILHPLQPPSKLPCHPLNLSSPTSPPFPHRNLAAVELLLAAVLLAAGSHPLPVLLPNQGYPKVHIE